MKVIFLGTPEFAAYPLYGIITASKHKVVAAVTQPERVNARGNKILPSPVKQVADKYKIPVYQFEKIARDGIQTLKALEADIMVTAAYGQILTPEVLNLCPKGVINVHPSLLPKYRGPSPIQWALINGDKETGVTIMKTAMNIDGGDIVLAKKYTLNGTENAGTLAKILAALGAKAVIEALDKIENGVATLFPQNEAEATFCKKLGKDMGKLNFNMPAASLANFIRGMTPKPSAYAFSPYGTIKIIRAAVSQKEYSGAPGEIVRADKTGFSVMCSEGAIDIIDVQGEGGKIMDSVSYLAGHPMKTGERLK
jgi:methionyl-tRNA formyltransferase